MNNDKKKKCSEQAIEQLVNPKNYGRMTAPDGAAIVKGQCGDTMEIYLTIKDEKISEILFYTDGCRITSACGSVVTELAKGKSIKDALKISPADIIDKLKDFLGNDSHCAILSVITLYKAIADYMLRK